MPSCVTFTRRNCLAALRNPTLLAPADEVIERSGARLYLLLKKK